MKGSTIPADQMVNLYRLIQQALPDTACRIIEVIAAHPGEGVSTVVFGLAEAASNVANARVLLCDATAERKNLRLFGVTNSLPSLSEVGSGNADMNQAIEHKRATLTLRAPGFLRKEVTFSLASAGISLCAVAKAGTELEAAAQVDRLDAVFMALRQQYDLILIDSPAITKSALGPALAKKADRVVLVIEADRTRVPVVAAAARTIEVNGGRVLGAVLNKRRFRIPRLFYR
jgi:polysaccharide biosynthesis transport protein